LEKTGILTPQQARDLGMTGPTARASGLSVDCRCDHPFGWYKTAPMYKIKLDSGDVFARTYIRYIEIKQSIAYLQNLMPQIPIQENTPTISSPCSLVAGCMEANSMAVSMVEGWRGEICHIAITDATGKLYHYKIKDPSFHNWHGLALAARNNGISDFPLCNKSFNLSYCGFDL
jgi:Ni,Fe-hydrogenase III large subunit